MVQVFHDQWKSRGYPADSVIEISSPPSNDDKSSLTCNHSLHLVCSGVHFLLFPKFVWRIIYKNGTKLNVSGEPIGKAFWTRTPRKPIPTILQVKLIDLIGDKDYFSGRYIQGDTRY